jgi:hypothetical protein
MIITLIAQNLKFGGLSDDDGTPQDRWPLIAKRLKSSSTPADIILFCEARDWEKQGHGPLARAMYDLDMDAPPLAPSSSGQHAAVLYRKETVGRWRHWNTGYSSQVTQSFGVAAFDVGLPSLLSVVSAHLTPYGADKALQEAALVASRGYRHGPFAIVGGDINYSPAQGLDPDFSSTRPYQFSSRTLLEQPDGKPVADRRVAQKFVQAGYVDVAYHMYEKTNDKKYLAHTCDYDRFDQFWVTQPLADAIVDYWLITSPAEASDHAGIAFSLDTEKIQPVTNWEYN